ncbi:MAG TPA: TraR/DksA C4-type zinc finger protein [Ktedonobacteraceae bacterium]|nr:TraR/DksA C4-type zinc finger protein [Ktedonobacteraceae bacterium]
MKLDLKKQKESLKAKKADLEQSIAGLTQAHPTPVSPAEANEGPQDTEDMATDLLEMQKEQSIMVNQQALLTLVENALKRLADGTYGQCQHCGKPIPSQRLEAIPWAERDIQCEEQLEHMYLSREEVYGPPQTFY